MRSVHVPFLMHLLLEAMHLKENETHSLCMHLRSSNRSISALAGGLDGLLNFPFLLRGEGGITLPNDILSWNVRFSTSLLTGKMRPTLPFIHRRKPFDIQDYRWPVALHECNVLLLGCAGTKGSLS